MPLGAEVGLGPGDIVLDGDPALPRQGAQQPLPTFRPMSIVAKRSPISATLSSCSATYPDWFSSTYYAERSAAVVDSEIRIADFRQVAPLCVVNVMNIELSDV